MDLHTHDDGLVDEWAHEARLDDQRAAHGVVTQETQGRILTLKIQAWQIIRLLMLLNDYCNLMCYQCATELD